MNKALMFVMTLSVLPGIMLSSPRPAQAVTYEVEIENFAYIPAGLHLNPGDAIEWRNRDAVLHSATSDDGIWDSGLLSRDQRFTYVFNVEGIFPYHCSAHPSMVDTVIVGNPTGTDDQKPATPFQFELSQNYPNPFNAQTEISYAVPVISHVRIAVYNLLGQEIATLVDEDLQAGAHQVVWDASTVPSGVYFYRIEAGVYAQTRKMTLIK